MRHLILGTIAAALMTTIGFVDNADAARYRYRYRGQPHTHHYYGYNYRPYYRGYYRYDPWYGGHYYYGRGYYGNHGGVSIHGRRGAVRFNW